MRGEGRVFPLIGTKFRQQDAPHRPFGIRASIDSNDAPTASLALGMYTKHSIYLQRLPVLLTTAGIPANNMLFLTKFPIDEN